MRVEDLQGYVQFLCFYEKSRLQNPLKITTLVQPVPLSNFLTDIHTIFPARHIHIYQVGSKLLPKELLKGFANLLQ